MDSRKIHIHKNGIVEKARKKTNNKRNNINKRKRKIERK